MPAVTQDTLRQHDDGGTRGEGAAVVVLRVTA
jgi:hypothetical protein